MSKYRGKYEGQIRQFKRLARAANTFRDVKTACDKLLGDTDSKIGRAYNVFFAGIAVSYMRPFGANEGLGSLPRNYSEFAGRDELAATHNDLADGRNWLFAHTDLVRGPSLLRDKAEEETHHDVTINVGEDGKVSYLSATITWKREQLKAVSDLCAHQLERANAEMASILDQMKGGVTLAPGSYTLGKDFP